MKLPWVSRKRLEKTERELAELRVELLEARRQISVLAGVVRSFPNPVRSGTILHALMTK